MLSRTAETVKTALAVMKATPHSTQPPFSNSLIGRKSTKRHGLGHFQGTSRPFQDFLTFWAGRSEKMVLRFWGVLGPQGFETPENGWQEGKLCCEIVQTSRKRIHTYFCLRN